MNASIVSARRLIRHNVSDEELEQYTKAYDVYRRSLTANRIALHASTLPELAMDWSRGFSPKYHMHVDTAVRLLLQTGQYYLASSLAKVGGKFDRIQLDMCAYTVSNRLISACPICFEQTSLAFFAIFSLQNGARCARTFIMCAQ